MDKYIEELAEQIMLDKNPLISFGLMEQVHEVLARVHDQEVIDLLPARLTYGWSSANWWQRDDYTKMVTARHTIRYRVDHGYNDQYTQNTWHAGQVCPVMEDIVAPAS